MKIKRFFVVLVAVCLFLTGCSSSFSWDKSVAKLEDAGYEVTRNYTTAEDLNKITKELNSEIKMNDKDFVVEVIKYMSLDKEKDGCLFLQFKEDDQAKKYYDLRIEIRNQFENSKLKFALYDDTVLIADAGETVNLLNLKFM